MNKMVIANLVHRPLRSLISIVAVALEVALDVYKRQTELSIEKRANAVDRMAAVLILQGWMERRGR